MRIKKKYLIAGGIAAALLIIPNLLRPSWRVITDWLIPELEGFRATPYWDYKQYSWGYGTRAPGPTGTITKEQAKLDAQNHMQGDYNYLRTLITRSLTGYQWAALLSFAYNLGSGNADNLVNNINTGNDAALHSQWLEYDNAGGSYNADLAERRRLEWDLWNGKV